MAQRVTTAIMSLVTETCETPNARLGGPAMEDHFPVIGPQAIECGALCQGEMSAMVPDRSDHEGRMVDAEWDPKSRSYRYFSLPARGWVTVPKGDLLNWDLDMGWLLGWIAGQFGLTLSSPPRALIPDRLWHLGTPWIGKRRCGLFFARRMGFGDGFDEIADVLQGRTGESPGVLLTTSRWSLRHARIPGNHRLVRLQDCLEHGEEARIDMEVLTRILAGIGGAVADGPIQYSNDYSTVTVHGRTFEFRGDMQKQAVGALIEARERGEEKVRTQVLLDSIGSEAGQILRLFRGHPDWKELIGYGNGFCWLVV